MAAGRAEGCGRRPGIREAKTVGKRRPRVPGGRVIKGQKPGGKADRECSMGGYQRGEDRGKKPTGSARWTAYNERKGRLKRPGTRARWTGCNERKGRLKRPGRRVINRLSRRTVQTLYYGFPPVFRLQTFTSCPPLEIAPPSRVIINT